MVLHGCPSLLSIAVANTTTKSNLASQQFIWPAGYIPFLGKPTTKTQGKNLEAGMEVERSATYWLVFPDGSPPIIGWTLLHPLAGKYIPHRHAHLTI